VIIIELFMQFLLISLFAFGGGQAALPLVAQIGVVQMGWISSSAFAAAVAFSYITPGPILITATFIGYVTAGFFGAIAATVGVFLAPTFLAALTAAGIERFANNRWLQAFGQGAAPAIVGLLGATTWNLAQQTVVSLPLFVVMVMTLCLASVTEVAPIWLLLGGAIAGWIVGFFA
jgi:chromate transporter